MTEALELTYAQCADLLGRREVGRVAVCTPAGPRIFPVNYAVFERSLVFRTSPYTMLGSHAWEGQLAFEVDQFDYEHRSGWSVVALGRGEMVSDSADLARILASSDPTPWAGGSRTLYVRLSWDQLTGRAIGHPALR